MSDQEINIAIAEACGWRQSERNIAHWHHVSEPYSHILTGDLPNYCNDLNAMHEALMMQTAEFRIRFRKELKHIIAPKTQPSKIKVSGICVMRPEEYDLWFHATARQHAEAFLRAIGKWKEETK